MEIRIASNSRDGLMVLCPRRFCRSGVTEIAIEDLKSAGVEAVLLDLDNTLVSWQGHDVPEGIRNWIVSLKSSGIKLCLVSNTRYGKRLRSLSHELDTPFVRRAWKPRKKG